MVVSDPAAVENARHELDDLVDVVTHEPDPYAAADGAHALTVLTDRSDYRYLDYARIYQDMAKPAALFDGHNCLDHPTLLGLVFDEYAIGKMLAMC